RRRTLRAGALRMCPSANHVKAVCEDGSARPAPTPIHWSHRRSPRTACCAAIDVASVVPRQAPPSASDDSCRRVSCPRFRAYVAPRTFCDLVRCEGVRCLLVLLEGLMRCRLAGNGPLESELRGFMVELLDLLVVLGLPMDEDADA